jgi:hypothetical protein
VCAACLFAVNAAIAARLFAVDFSAYTGSVEGTFIEIARFVRQHPFQWSWFPLWTVGMPFENTYLPFLQWVVAAFSALTGISVARSFHIVTAAFYAAGPPALFWMALQLSRKLATSFLAALLYSCVAFSTLLIPAVRVDAGGALHLRRLHALVVYGEAPHTVALTLLPLAIVCFARALSTRTARWNIAAGVLAAAVVLSNAFGIVALGLALVCWLAAIRSGPWRVALIGLVTYCWTAPWLSPSMIRAILHAPNEYPYQPITWLSLALMVAGFLVLCRLLRRAKAEAALQFFVLYAYAFTGIVLLWYFVGIALLPQPHRYQLEMDLALSLAVVFGAAALGRGQRLIGAVVLTALCAQTVYCFFYACSLIRSVHAPQLAEYRIAKWMDEHLPGERAFIGDSATFLYNVFTDNPQVRGGHVQFEPNSFINVVAFTIYTDTNAGDRAAEASIFWLKAFGARAIAVSGPQSTQHFKAFAHPQKFDGVLPLLWREGGDSIYEVPSRTHSLAHVIPVSAVVTRRPADGLDTAPAAAYVAALDDAHYPTASFKWNGFSAAQIDTVLGPGQVVAVQETYDPGWEAWANGHRQPIRPDALGLLVIEPDCSGTCEISLRYSGGIARLAGRGVSVLAMLFAAIYAWRATCRPSPSGPSSGSRPNAAR